MYMYSNMYVYMYMYLYVCVSIYNYYHYHCYFVEDFSKCKNRIPIDKAMSVLNLALLPIMLTVQLTWNPDLPNALHSGMFLEPS